MAAVLKPAPEPLPSIAETLSAFSQCTGYDEIPAATRERAKHLMLDAIGIGFASTTFEFAPATLAGAQALAGSGEHPVVGMGARLPLRDAVMVNGVLLHGLDYDDTHVPGIIHPTASLLPTVLGQGAALHSSGRDVLAAYVIGLESATRVGAVVQGGFHQKGFHPTGLVGTFGCTIAAGRLIGLTERQMTMAQGIALSMAGGSLEFLEDGSWTKRLHPGWAGVAGITAATLARHGFIGPRAAYEGRFGLFALHTTTGAAGSDLSLATRELGRLWEVHEVAVKPFPLCHFTHACADAAIALHRQGIEAGQIERVQALVPAGVVQTVCEPVANKRRPKNDYDAKFSIPFVVAAGLVRGRVGLAELEPAALNDPALLGLADRVDYAIDPASGFPKYYSGEVVVTLKDGRVMRHREAINRGCSDRPITEGEIVAKFMENASLALPRARAEKVCATILALDKAADIKLVADALA